MPPADTHLTSLRKRMITIELLSLAKKSHTYRELAEITNLPITVLSRYVKGHVLPSSSRAEALRSALEQVVSLEKLLRDNVKFDEAGYFDNSSIIWDLNLLRLAAYRVIETFAGRKITKIMTAEADGIPFATVVASEMGKGLLVARKTREVGVSDWLEDSYTPSNSAVVITLHVPKYMIRRNDSILIVDDVTRTGETQRSLVELVLKAKASVVGVVTLIGIGNAWKQKLALEGDFILDSIVEMNEPIKQ
ncbi:MAG: adenine phosphoribosyltransferase [Candidatus Brockarchaeota archaeon]|nr:adenine phosphoribosyltransferase [Candidatus Brockarchaeota archaeon]